MYVTVVYVYESVWRGCQCVGVDLCQCVWCVNVVFDSVYVVSVSV